MSTILVSGGSGFLASHCIVQLLAAGHDVRTTIRGAKREADVRQLVASGGADPGARLSFYVADLERDEGWAAASEGAEYVLHVASPFPAAHVEDEATVIGPAKGGALLVLRAARDAGVRRVVLTSSFAAIGYGHPQRAAPFDEKDFTDPNAPGLTAYLKSKVIAERAAWDFIAQEGRDLELTVVNPVGIFGPALGPDVAPSIQIVIRMLQGKIPFCPRLYFGVVDVRDVADLHLRAMTDPAAKGERFLASAGDAVAMIDIAKALRDRLGERAAKAPRAQLPDIVTRLVALARKEMRPLLPELGKVKHLSNAKAKRVLGWTPRSSEDAVVATAESLFRLGLVSSP